MLAAFHITRKRSWVVASNLTFLCDAKHSCGDDNLLANYYSLFATDQIDFTDKLKFRAGVRQDWFETSLTPLISVPGRFGTNALFEPAQLNRNAVLSRIAR